MCLMCCEFSLCWTVGSVIERRRKLFVWVVSTDVPADLVQAEQTSTNGSMFHATCSLVCWLVTSCHCMTHGLDIKVVDGSHMWPVESGALGAIWHDAMIWLNMIDIFIEFYWYAMLTQCWRLCRSENFDARPCSICCKSCWQLRMGHWESPIHIGHIATLAREKRLRATWATWWDGMIGMAKQPVTVPRMEPFIKVIKGQLGSCRVYFMLRENRESEFGPSWSFKF